jgi:hypothetical protein
MPVGAADLHEGIVTAWTNGALNADFNQYWTAAERTRYPVLSDGEAQPGHPFPYCVFEIGPSVTVTRMTSPNADEKAEIRDVPLTFRIYTASISGDARSAKQIAAAMAERVMRIFGGHPSQVPGPVTLSNGNFLISQFQSDFGIRVGEDEHQWTVQYTCRIDVPIAV